LLGSTGTVAFFECQNKPFLHANCENPLEISNPKVPLSFVALGSQKSGMVLHFLCFYGEPTLSTWFTNEYKKSGKKLDMGP
jgi:hypothetical protein